MAARGNNHGIGYGVAKLRVKRAMKRILFGLFLSVVANGALACPAGYTCVPFDAGGAKTWGNTDSGFSWPTNLAACIAIFTPLPPSAVEISVGGDVSGHNSFGQCLIRYSYDQNFYLTFVYVYAVGSCPAGYKNNGTDCQKPIVACPAHASGTPCVCDAGYKFDAAGTSCVANDLIITLYGGTTTEPSTLLPFNTVVKDQNGVVQSGKQVTITVDVKDGTGGHIHNENRPKGIFTCGSVGSPSTCTLTTDYSGQAPFEFVATPISGTHTITASCSGCSNTATKSVDVKVNGLIPIPGSSRYALTDSAGVVIGAVTNKHTANHYLTSAAIVKLEKLAKTYSKVNPGAKLYLNDASLTWGGLFDVGNTSWSSPHSVHDKGRSLDIRAANSGPNNEGAVPATVFREFIDEARLKKFNVGLHCKNSSDTNYCLGQPNNRHFHVDF